jgi:shikimate kinase
MPPGPAIVFLVGFMGAGKSTVAKALGRLLGWATIDLDEALVQAEGRGIARILQESGEPHFRDLERRILEGLAGSRHLVVACGGGTYAHGPSRAVIDRLGKAVWLQAPVGLCLRRCQEGPARPLLRSAEQAEALYRRRLPAYRAAPLSVAVGALTPEQIALRIAALL